LTYSVVSQVETREFVGSDSTVTNSCFAIALKVNETKPLGIFKCFNFFAVEIDFLQSLVELSRIRFKI